MIGEKMHWFCQSASAAAEKGGILIICSCEHTCGMRNTSVSLPQGSKARKGLLEIKPDLENPSGVKNQQPTPK